MRHILNKLLFRSKFPTCKIGKGAIVSRKAVVGENCVIGMESSISSTVHLGNGVIIGAGVSLNNIDIGSNTMIESGVKVLGTSKGKLIIGKECYIGVNNVLDSSDNITIGDYVHIAGPSTGLWCHASSQMVLNSIPLHDKDRSLNRPTAPIHIESNVYIGGNCTIYPGVIIGHHSIIAPNSVIAKNVPSNVMMGNEIAKIIKRL